MVFYPLNNIEYTAEDAQLFNCTRNSGIYAYDDFRCEVTGVDNNVTVNLGLGWMRLDRFKGGVFALKDRVEVVNLGLPNETLPRIDVVGVRYSANDNAIKVFSKQGTPASEPKVPPIVQTADTYELYFCAVRRPAGATSITADMVTDLRLNKIYCGVMADSITKVDTVAINTQITALIKRLDDEIKKAHDGSAWLLKSEVADYIVEENLENEHSNKWSFRKYNSGVAECWITYRLDMQSRQIPCNTPWGTLYATDTFAGLDYPLKFKSAPSDFVSIKKAGFDLIVIKGLKNAEATTTKSSSFALTRPTPIDNLVQNDELTVSIRTIGRWK